MTRFYVGWMAYYPPQHTSQNVNKWFRINHTEIHHWVVENAGERWSLEYFPVRDINDDADLFFLNVFLVYEDERLAILHKLRWE